MRLFRWLYGLYLKWYKPGMKAHMKHRKEEEYKGKWEVSFVRCDICRHRWIACRPAGLDRLECPHCSAIATFEDIEEENTF